MKKFSFALALLLGTLPSLPASAQPLNDRDVRSVKERPEPDYEPLGGRVWGFLVHPSIGVDQVYDSNIFRTDTSEESDWITRVVPGLEIISDWNNHQLKLGAQGRFGYYGDNNREDYEDYNVYASGRLDMAYETYFTGLVRFQHLHEDRGSPDDVGGIEPTEYDVFTGRLGFTRALGKLKLYTSAQYQEYDYDDVASSAGFIIDNDARDRSQELYKLRLAYTFIPNYDIFIEGAHDRRDYDISGTSFDRSSTGYDLVVGTAINFSGKAKGEVYVGYLEQDYETSFEDVDTISYGGNLLWNISGLTSLMASVDRDVYETTLGSASAYVRTDYEIAAEHALRRNVILDANLGYAIDDFIGGGIGTGPAEREDDYYYASFGVDWLPFRGAKLRAGYDYRDRNSNSLGSDYTSHRFLASLSYTY